MSTSLEEVDLVSLADEKELVHQPITNRARNAELVSRTPKRPLVHDVDLLPIFDQVIDLGQDFDTDVDTSHMIQTLR